MRGRLAIASLSLALAFALVISKTADGSESAYQKALELLRDGETEAARVELRRLLASDAQNAEVYHQMARSYLIDFHAGADPVRSRNALNLALEALGETLRRNPDHIPALKAKAVIHARAELLHYDPNLAYEMAARVAKLQPSASEYLLGLTDWMSGEVRFLSDHVSRVPHDPLVGLDRSIEILSGVIDSAMPYSNDEAMALFQMGRTQAKRGSFKPSIRFFELALRRVPEAAARAEILRELGTSQYRLGNYPEAARTFYRALQYRLNPADAWLLRTSLDQWKTDGIALPPEMQFAAADPGKAPAALALEDAAKELGVNRLDGNGTCAFGDIDQDGVEDLVLAGSGTFLAVYRKEGERFVEITDQTGLSGVPSGYSLNLVDFDNDGKLDLYISLNGWNGPMSNRLYRNEGGGRFKDLSKASGADDPGSGFVSLWGDLDNDGLLDLVVANGVLKDGSTPQIYRNAGGGRFQNVTREAGIREPPTHGTIGAALGDYDRDGDLDIFFNGLGGAANRLYRNAGGMKFVEVAHAAGVTQPTHNGFVAFFTDYNNDAYPDLLTTSLAPWDAVVQSLSRFFKVPNRESIHADAPRLFRNNRDGTFSDATFEAKLYYPMGVMGAGVADVDNDGFVDFYFGTGDPQLSRLEPNRLFHNSSDGTFRDVTYAGGLAQPGKKGHGVCFIDLDDDGDLELYAQLGGHYPGDHAENAFYRNLKGNSNNWLELELTGTRSNRFGVGATVTLKAAGMTLHREVKGSEGFGATSPYRVHFGLGDRKQVDELEVIWPSGIKQKLQNVQARQLLKLTEPKENGPR